MARAWLSHFPYSVLEPCLIPLLGLKPCLRTTSVLISILAGHQPPDLPSTHPNATKPFTHTHLLLIRCPSSCPLTHPVTNLRVYPSSTRHLPLYLIHPLRSPSVHLVLCAWGSPPAFYLTIYTTTHLTGSPTQLTHFPFSPAALTSCLRCQGPSIQKHRWG